MEKPKTPYPSLRKLPHTKEELRKYGDYTIPTYLGPQIEDVETSWTIETTNLVNDISEAVDVTHNKTTDLKQRVDGLEDKVKEIEATGAVLYDSCFRGKRLSGLQPRPPTPIDENKILAEKLSEKLRLVNLQLVRQRNLIQKMREEVKLYQRLLRAEVGEGLNLADPALRLRNFGGWKGRSQIIMNLRAKIAMLEHQQHESYGQSGRGENGYEAIKKHNPEPFIPKYQRANLDKIYMNQYDQFRFKEQDLAATKDRCKELSKICSSALSRNSALAKRLKDTNVKIKGLEAKSTEDAELIRSLMQHQKVLRNVIEKQSCVNKQSSIREQDVHILLSTNFEYTNEDKETESTKQMASETYKTLWQTSENKAKSLEDIIRQLHQRLDMVTANVIEAEKHCCNHQAKLKEIESKFDQMIRTGKVYTKAQIGSGKQVARLLLTEEELNMKKNENRLLRGFLKQILNNKAEDFNLYKTNLELAKKDYLLSLDKMKKSFKGAPEGEEEGEEAEEKEDDESEGEDES